MFGNKNNKHVDQEVFAIFDTKAGSYQQPLFAINKLTIIRELEALFKDPQQQNNFLVSNSEDFVLFKIGEYDRKTAEYTQTTKESITTLVEIKSMVEAQARQKTDLRQVN